MKSNKAGIACLRQIPALKSTCEFSRWRIVCERLIDTEPYILALCAERAHHIRARVGYDQGAQVPHPAAPDFAMRLKRTRVGGANLEGRKSLKSCDGELI